MLARTCARALSSQRQRPSPGRPWSALQWQIRDHTSDTTRRTARLVSPYRSHFQRQQNRSYSSRATPARLEASFADPDRTDLFYHLIDAPSEARFPGNPRVFGLSFLSYPPSMADSDTVIGWLPAMTAGSKRHVGLHDFKENPKFRHVLHDAIKEALNEGIDDIQINSALQLQQGWMHIHAPSDNRNLPPLGRIGDPDDILASVFVRDGKILVDTYQPMPSYRICTSDGLTQLTDGLQSKLLQKLAERHEAETLSL